jgi:hypothetical protein
MREVTVDLQLIPESKRALGVFLRKPVAAGGEVTILANFETGRALRRFAVAIIGRSDFGRHVFPRSQRRGKGVFQFEAFCSKVRRVHTPIAVCAEAIFGSVVIARSGSVLGHCTSLDSSGRIHSRSCCAVLAARPGRCHARHFLVCRDPCGSNLSPNSHRRVVCRQCAWRLRQGVATFRGLE